MPITPKGCRAAVVRRYRALGPGLLVCVLAFVAHAQSSDTVWGVYPARINDGSVALYGVVRQIPDYPVAKGKVLAVQITASDGAATTAARERAGRGPCRKCTAAHYFDLRKPAERRPKLLIHAPGPVTYLVVDDKEYALMDIRLAWADDGPRLERATLMRTGFLPPIFKEKIRIRFDGPLQPGSHADAVADMALADMAMYQPPGDTFERAASGRPSRADPP